MQERVSRVSPVSRVSDYLRAIPQSITFYDVDITPRYSEVHPTDVDLRTTIGPITMHLPIFSPPMDTVTEPPLAKALSVLGGCGILYRHPDRAVQLAWVEEVLSYRWCMIKDPVCLSEDSRIDEAERILKERGFSTIPVKDAGGRLASILFTRDVAFKWHREDPVSRWAVPLEKLKIVMIGTKFSEIRDRLLNEQECSVLPVVDDDAHLHGMYFMKDIMNADPSEHGGKPLVGIAIGVDERDLERAEAAVKLGAGVVVIDSSHGDSLDAIAQTKRLTDVAPHVDFAIVAGNIADVDGEGYRRLAEAGADAVKVGIGSGSICTTTGVTGAGVGMVTALRACAEMRRSWGRTTQAPKIIADGGVTGSGEMAKALLVGADAVMAGQWLVAATESASAQRGHIRDGKVYYRGMASSEAIAIRMADRYGKKKSAAEGVAGWVRHRGALREWLPEDMELVRGGFAHAGARDLAELHDCGNDPNSLSRYTSLGRMQAAVRIET